MARWSVAIFLNLIVYMPMLDKVYSVVEVNKIISVENLGQHIILDLYMSKRRLGAMTKPSSAAHRARCKYASRAAMDSEIKPSLSKRLRENILFSAIVLLLYSFPSGIERRLLALTSTL